MTTTPNGTRRGIEEHRGFFSSLFDLSFERFVTPGVIKTLFVIAIIIGGLGALALVGAGFKAGGP